MEPPPATAEYEDGVAAAAVDEGRGSPRGLHDAGEVAVASAERRRQCPGFRLPAGRDLGGDALHDGVVADGMPSHVAAFGGPPPIGGIEMNFHRHRRGMMLADGGSAGAFMPAAVPARCVR